MIPFNASTVFWVMIASCAIGLLATFFIRRSEGSSSHAVCTGLFFISLLIVGLTAIFFLCVPSGLGLFAGITLGMMIVVTTCDFRQQSNSTVFHRC